MDIFKITVETDGGPWARHNMPCAVCQTEHAVLDLSDGIYHPCWKCQAKGYKLVRTNWLKQFMTEMGKLYKFGEGKRPESVPHVVHTARKDFPHGG